jgi:hypothetical protein
MKVMSQSERIHRSVNVSSVYKLDSAGVEHLQDLMGYFLLPVLENLSAKGISIYGDALVRSLLQCH